MPLIQPRLKFVGAVPVDAETLNNSIEAPVQIPATAAASLPVEIVLGQYNSRNPVLLLDSVQLISQAAIAADATNYDIFTLYDRGPAGAGTTVLATWSTLSSAQGALAAFVPVNMVLASTDAAISPGDVLSLAVTKASTGQALPNSTIELKFKQ